MLGASPLSSDERMHQIVDAILETIVADENLGSSVLRRNGGTYVMELMKHKKGVGGLHADCACLRNVIIVVKLSGESYARILVPNYDDGRSGAREDGEFVFKQSPGTYYIMRGAARKSKHEITYTEEGWTLLIRTDCGEEEALPSRAERAARRNKSRRTDA